MNLIRWDPWKEFERLRAETDGLWDVFLDKLSRSQADPQRIAFLPDVDLVETPGEYCVYFSVPGLIEEDMDLTIGERSITVRGERQPPYDPSHAQRQLGEWRYGFFERRIQLSQPIQREEARAHYDDGVLTIVLPKA